jgi:DTW domain-containing protein YfiP
MHVAETKTSTNTGRLATRLVPGGSVWIRGEMGATPRSLSDEAPHGLRLILFPLEGARTLSPDLAAELRSHHDRLDLVVPDGTWRQASKAVRREGIPWLQESQGILIALDPRTLDVGKYGLRVAPRDETVCTLDAIGRALELLEGGELGAQIRKRFDEVLEIFVERTLWSRGKTRTADLKYPLPPGAAEWRRG